MRLQSDERLATLARDGHEPAFAAIVHRYQGPLLRYCAGIVGPARAEDAVQQAFINAHDALPRMTEVRHLKSWLHRIAHNVSLNMLRAARDEVALDDGQAALAPPPADAYESAERVRLTLQAVRDLPERQRAALVLRELEGRSHIEIAEALGTTAGGARQHLLRARAALRQAVTAITPYPVIAKAAAAVADPSAARVAEAVAGAGAGATVIKLTAGLAATGALVGGVVGTDAITKREPPATASAQRAAPHRPAPGSPARQASATIPSAQAGSGAAGPGDANGGDGRGRGDGKGGRDNRRGSGTGATGGGGSHSGPGSGREAGDDHAREDDHFGREGDRERSSTSGRRSGDDDDRDRRSGSGTSDDDRSGSDGGDAPDDGSGSGSGSGTSGSGGSGTSDSGTDGTSDSGTSGTSGSGTDGTSDGGTSSTSGSGTIGSGTSGSGLSGGGESAFDEPDDPPTTTTPDSLSASGSDDALHDAD